MEIKWLGHSCFYITSKRSTLLTDPYDSYVGYKMPEVSADVVLVSHNHKDHAYIEGVKNYSYLITEVGNYTIDGFDIDSVTCYHDKAFGKLRGNNIIFRIQAEGKSIVHLGDIGDVFVEELERFKNTDVLLIPVGGTYTVDAEEAAKIVRIVNPRFVIPMHYKTEDCEFPITPVDDFLKLFPSANVFYTESNTFSVPEHFVSEDTRVIVLKKF